MSQCASHLKAPLSRHPLLTLSLLALLLLGLSGSAWAHHPLDGIPMQYFWHGLLSGVAHPLLGIDHLFFIIAIAVTGIFSDSPIRTLAVVIAGVLAGVLLVTFGMQLSWIELAVALSLVVIGLLLFSGIALVNSALLPLLAVLSVFHGYAYGQALTAQSALPLVVILGFLAGIPLIYGAVVFAARWVATSLLANLLPGHSPARIVGALVASAGLAFI